MTIAITLNPNVGHLSRVVIANKDSPFWMLFVSNYRFNPDSVNTIEDIFFALGGLFLLVLLAPPKNSNCSDSATGHQPVGNSLRNYV